MGHTETKQQLTKHARRQLGCRAFMGHYGIGPLTAVAILSEQGGVRRFSSSSMKLPAHATMQSPLLPPANAKRATI